MGLANDPASLTARENIREVNYLHYMRADEEVDVSKVQDYLEPEGYSGDERVYRM